MPIDHLAESKKLIFVMNRLDEIVFYKPLTRQEIGGILATLNTAFDNLRNDLLTDTALDISSEISAMQTMLAQDGLAEYQS